MQRTKLDLLMVPGNMGIRESLRLDHNVKGVDELFISSQQKTFVCGNKVKQASVKKLPVTQNHRLKTHEIVPLKQKNAKHRQRMYQCVSFCDHGAANQCVSAEDSVHMSDTIKTERVCEQTSIKMRDTRRQRKKPAEEEKDTTLNSPVKEERDGCDKHQLEQETVTRNNSDRNYKGRGQRKRKKVDERSSEQAEKIKGKKKRLAVKRCQKAAALVEESVNVTGSKIHSVESVSKAIKNKHQQRSKGKRAKKKLTSAVTDSNPPASSLNENIQEDMTVNSKRRCRGVKSVLFPDTNRRLRGGGKYEKKQKDVKGKDTNGTDEPGV